MSKSLEVFDSCDSGNETVQRGKKRKKLLEEISREKERSRKLLEIQRVILIILNQF